MGRPRASSLDVCPSHALSFLRGRRSAISAAPQPPVALGQVRLCPVVRARSPASTLDTLRGIVGSEGVRDDRVERIAHAAGKGYPDLVRLRAGEPEGAPDAVVLPSAHDQVRAVLELCARLSIAVVPFGGGTSVVGGVAPLRGEHGGVIALDMGRMSEVPGLDRESLTVTVQAGVRAPALERYLLQRGLTLGHFPQSFEYVSLGGCAATRSAGQASSGYGASRGGWCKACGWLPRRETSAGRRPGERGRPKHGVELLIGSEGVLGVIGELSLRVRAAPQKRAYEGVFFEDFSAGVEALRTLAQEHVSPAVARLSDEHETRMSLALAGGGVKGKLGRLYVGLRGYREGCLAILGFEGAPNGSSAKRERALEMVRRYGGLASGAHRGGSGLLTLLGPLPARRAAHARRDGGDARDGHAMVEPVEGRAPSRRCSRRSRRR